MAATPLEALVSGLALGGVLAVAAAWSRAVRGGPIPHLGVGATAGLGIVIASRLSGAAGLWAAAAVVLAGAVAGRLAGAADQWIGGGGGRRADWPPPPPFLADVAVLAALLAAAAVLRPALAIPVPFGPLGGRPSPTGGLAALVVGATGAWLVSRARRGSAAPWWVAGAATAAAAALAGGALGPAVSPLLALPTIVDGAGLAFRAAAAALLGRRSPMNAALAGLALGVGEGLLWLVSPVGSIAVAPAVLAAALGVWAARTPARRLEALGP